jgi:hypothetical protein
MLGEIWSRAGRPGAVASGTTAHAPLRLGDLSAVIGFRHFGTAMTDHQGNADINPGLEPPSQDVVVRIQANVRGSECCGLKWPPPGRVILLAIRE